jgi:hypothetical protein
MDSPLWGGLSTWLQTELAIALRPVIQIGEKIMATEAELVAALSTAQGTLDTVATEVSALATEVRDLIGRLGSAPISTGTLAQAQAISDKLAALDTALKAIPPEPPVPPPPTP